MKTVTIFLVALRLTHAIPVPGSVAVENINPTSNGPTESTNLNILDNLGLGLARSLLGGEGLKSGNSGISVESPASASADVTTDPVNPNGGNIAIDTDYCCFDMNRVADRACDVQLCLQNFFDSEDGRPVANAILTGESTELPPISNLGRRSVDKMTRRSEVFDKGDLTQCTAQLVDEGGFGTDAPLCQQLLLDFIAPEAGEVYREAAKSGNMPAAMVEGDHRGNNAMMLPPGKIVSSLAELEGN